MPPAIASRLQEKAKGMAIKEENCTGCLLCQLRCSLAYLGLFNPSQAYIKIERDGKHRYNFRIDFTPTCRKGCKLCAMVCPYDCLVPKAG